MDPNPTLLNPTLLNLKPPNPAPLSRQSHPAHQPLGRHLLGLQCLRLIFWGVGFRGLGYRVFRGLNHQEEFSLSRPCMIIATCLFQKAPKHFNLQAPRLLGFSMKVLAFRNSLLEPWFHGILQVAFARKAAAWQYWPYWPF